jgi:hypothetical protein
VKRSETGSFNIFRRCFKPARAGSCQRIDQSPAVSALWSGKTAAIEYLGADRAQAGTGLVH